MRDPQLSLLLPGTDRRTESRELMQRLRRDAAVIGAPFELVPKSLGFERDDASHYGICYADGSIKIRLRHARTGRVLRYSSLVNTLCHELAHLEHMDHGDGFKALFFRVLDYARKEGLYRPAKNVVSAGCGVALVKAPRDVPSGEAEQLYLVMPIPGRMRPPRR